nr:MAG TPA: hypothetical protein [Caudoviricetes sp.]
MDDAQKDYITSYKNNQYNSTKNIRVYHKR